jgi:glycosyltransferase involved in cell wall biosynthesis
MLSIVIPTHDRDEILPKTFAMLREITWPDIEFLFLDNGSPRASVQLLEEFALTEPRATILQNHKNIGFPRSMYRGVLSAQHDWQLFLSDEDVVTPDFVRKLREIRTSHPNVGAAFILESDLYHFAKPVEARIERGGRRAAYAAYWISGQIGGLVWDRRRLDVAKVPLDKGIFPQRWISCAIALKSDVCFMPNQNYLRSEENRAERTEFAIRTGDWALGEWMDHAELVLYGPGAVSEFPDGEEENYARALRWKVFSMFDSYMRQSMANVGPGSTEQLVRSVLADRRFANDLVFWEFVFNYLLGMPEQQRFPIIDMFRRSNLKTAD